MCQKNEWTNLILLLTLMNQRRPSSLLTAVSVHTCINSLVSTLCYVTGRHTRYFNDFACGLFKDREVYMASMLSYLVSVILHRV